MGTEFVSLEEYLAGLTGKQLRALALKLWGDAGGERTGSRELERYRAGILRMDLVPRSFPKPRLYGTVIVTLHLKPFKVKSIDEAIKLGKLYIGYPENTTLSNMAEFLTKDELRLEEEVVIDLIQFNRDHDFKEVVAWAEAHKRLPIMPRHLLGFALQHRSAVSEGAIFAPGKLDDAPIIPSIFEIFRNKTEDWSPSCRSAADFSAGPELNLFGFLH